MNGLMHRSNYDVIPRITGPYPRSDLRVLVRIIPGHDGRSDDRVLQQPRDRPARDLPADFRRGYRGPKIACSIERPADTAPIGAPFWRCVIGIYAALGHSRQGCAGNRSGHDRYALKRKQLRSTSNSATGYCRFPMFPKTTNLLLFAQFKNSIGAYSILNHTTN